MRPLARRSTVGRLIGPLVSKRINGGYSAIARRRRHEEGWILSCAVAFGDRKGLLPAIMTRLNESSTELNEPSSDSSVEAPSEIWLDGGVLACACPECGAPMSIRLWLALADCFRCGTSVELTEEQEEYARRLLDDWQKRQVAELEGASRIRSTMRRAPAGNGSSPVTAPPPRPAPHTPPRRPRPRRESPWSDPVEETQPVSRAEVLRHVLHPARWRSLGEAILTDLPAWLISLIVHLIFILLLGLLNIAYEPPRPSITLSTSINYRDTPGEEGLLEERLAEPFEFEEAGDFEPMDL
ncbi:MAG: hypothetical protein D6741_02765, partial [Planctomycetota bacterium]